ncbi:hypothetical protein D9M69_695010 [compost metagenome]
MACGNRGDQVRAAGQRQGRRESADHGADIARKAEGCQGVVHRSAVPPLACDQQVLAGGIADGGDPALAERVAHAHDTDEVVAEQPAATQLGAGGLADHAGLQVDAAIP